MPYKYQYIRDGARSVRKEYYTLISKMRSELHMSQAQAEGAVVHTANDFFGRKWKVHQINSEIDKNTLPLCHVKNMVRT